MHRVFHFLLRSDLTMVGEGCWMGAVTGGGNGAPWSKYFFSSGHHWNVWTCPSFLTLVYFLHSPIWHQASLGLLSTRQPFSALACRNIVLNSDCLLLIQKPYVFEYVWKRESGNRTANQTGGPGETKGIRGWTLEPNVEAVNKCGFHYVGVWSAVKSQLAYDNPSKELSRPEKSRGGWPLPCSAESLPWWWFSLY